MILVACEESQAVTIEFRRLGYEAYSCDIIDCSGGHPEWHIKGDVLPLLNGNSRFQTMDGEQHEVVGKWDMILAFPPCTHLAVSGARHFEKKRADGRQRDAVEFFCQFLSADCDRIAIENPIGIISGKYVRKWFPDLADRFGLPKEPDQITSPNEHGDPYEKRTCLWLKNLSKLTPSKVTKVPPRQVLTSGKTIPAWYSKKYSRENPNGKSRQSMRSETFPGIARAMAERWSKELKTEGKP